MNEIMKAGAKFFLGIGVSGTGYDVQIIPHISHALAMAEIEHLDGIATIDKKAQHPLVIAVAAAFEAPIMSFSATELEAQTPHLASPSAALFARLGCHGVAEAAALAAAGAGGTLLIPKTTCHKATFAIASTFI